MNVFAARCSDFIQWHSKTSDCRRTLLRSYQLSLQPAVCQKLVICCGCMLFFLTVTRSLPIKYNADHDFVSHAPFLTRLTYAFFSIQAARPKFYFAWTLGEHNMCFELVCCSWPIISLTTVRKGAKGCCLYRCVSHNLSFTSRCCEQRCRLWFLGDGWKWKAIMGSHLQPQHLGDWGKNRKQAWWCVRLYADYFESKFFTDLYSYCYVGATFHW